jgi:NAD(P)H-quinone oxidoreductase subunit 5
MSQWLIETSWLVPCYGLLGAIATLPWSIGSIQRTGPRPAAYLNLLATLLAVIHGGILFRSLIGEPAQFLDIAWLQVADLDLSFRLEISAISTGAMELVTGLSLAAQLYALGYLEKDYALARFFGLMGFFEAAMAGLAISDSLLLSYGLLEMLTLSTYLIVGFWYAQPLVIRAARDAFLTKRVGDILLLMGVITLSALAGSLNFESLNTWAATNPLPPWQATLLGLALMAGPVGKCAQFPLHLWLDEAMEGPNPASIMRNSVVVACGAYVLIKLIPVLAMSPVVLDTALVLGTVTAIGASLVAIAQIDIKRALSHSTSAYLGLVFVAVGLQETDVALLLLVVHAIAKATLFMSAGSVILTTNSQNITEMGGLGTRMPATTLAFMTGAAGMVALLPLGTFWVFFRWISYGITPTWVVALVLGVNALSALNLVRVFGLVFAGAPQPKTRRAPEVLWPMAVPMLSLVMVTLLGPLILEQWTLLLSWSRGDVTAASAPAWPMAIALLGSGAFGAAAGGAIYLYGLVPRPVKLPSTALQDLFAYDFYIDRAYRITIALGVGALSRAVFWFDRYIVDGLVNLVGVATIFSGESLKYSTSGRSQGYLLVVLVGVSLLVGAVGWSLAYLWF